MRGVSKSARCLRIGIAAACLSCCLSGPAPAATDPTTHYPWAQRAIDARQLALAADRYVSAGPTRSLTDALGGRWGRQKLLTLAGHVSSALGASDLAEPQWTQVADLARQRGDVAAELAALSTAVQAALSLGAYERSRALADRQRALALRVGDRSAEAEADNISGVIERRLGRLDRALQYQQHALALFQADANSIAAQRVLSDIGTVWRDRGDFAQALGAHLEALAGRERSGDRLDSAYRNLALLYREIDATTARGYFERALQEAERRAVPSTYASVVGSYAGLLNDLGEFSRARAAAEEALAIDTALGDRPHQGFEHLELARALLGQNDRQAAAVHLEQALLLGRALDQREIVARALLHLTEIALERRDRMHARGLIDEAVAGLEHSRLLPQLAQAYSLREQMARGERDDATALRYARKYNAVREELIGIRASRQLAALEARHARADTEQQLALLAKDNELQAARLDKQAIERRGDIAALAGLALLLLALLWRHVGVRRLNRVLAARNAEIERQRARLAEANATLEQQAAGLYQAATTDALTGVSNRRDLLMRLEQRVHDCQRAQRPLGLLLIDFDHFKQINDRRGHLFGDRVLSTSAGIMRECLGDDDLLGRFGGEEFLAVVCDRSPTAVLRLADRIRTRIADHLATLMPELSAIATISTGVAMLDPSSTTTRPETLIDAADKALYAAKNAGRNRVCHTA